MALHFALQVPWQAWLQEPWSSSSETEGKCLACHYASHAYLMWSLRNTLFLQFHPFHFERCELVCPDRGPEPSRGNVCKRHLALVRKTVSHAEDCCCTGSAQDRLLTLLAAGDMLGAYLEAEWPCFCLAHGMHGATAGSSTNP